MKPIVPGQIMFGVPQAATVIGISKSLMWRLVLEGQIKSTKIGARRLVHRSELERFAKRSH